MATPSAAVAAPVVACGGGFRMTGEALDGGSAAAAAAAVYACERAGAGGGAAERGAAKLEAVHARKRRLHGEARVYDDVAAALRRAPPETRRGAAGLPRKLHFGVAGGHAVLVIERLGATLESIPLASRSLVHVADVAWQLLWQYELLHDAGYIHRDAKLDNVLLDAGAPQPRPPHAHVGVHLIDYGLAARYRVGGPAVAARVDHAVTCASRYASLNAHRGIEQCRADDLESLVYMLIHYAKGSLPWNTEAVCKLDKSARQRAIGEAKLRTSVAELCAGLPEEFVHIVEYVRSLGFSQRPDYARVRSWFQAAAARDIGDTTPGPRVDDECGGGAGSGGAGGDGVGGGGSEPLAKRARVGGGSEPGT